MRRFVAVDLKNVYSPFHEPVGSVAPGESFQVETEDCFGGRFRDPASFTPENIAWVEENLDLCTGPVAVEGARAGDVVAIQIHEIEVTTPGSYELSRHESASPEDWWHELYGCGSYPIEDGRVVFSERSKIPIRPIVGCLATAPKHEVVYVRRESNEFGGNLDCTDFCAGATVLLPVNVDGALLYFGDCKAGLSDGEVVCPPECGTMLTLTATIRPRPRTMSAPRIETPDRLVTLFSDVSLTRACRQAFREMLLWLEEEYEVPRREAALVMGMVAPVSVCQVANTFYTGRCSMPREHIPR